MTCIGSLSCQSLSPQPFQILAQCFLLLFVFGQWAVRWTEYVVGVIFAFAHDVTFRQLDRSGPGAWESGGQVNRGRPAIARGMGAIPRPCWRKRFPVYPLKQTSQKRESMSAEGQKRTHA